MLSPDTSTAYTAATVDEALPGLLERLLAQRPTPSRNGTMVDLGHTTITLTEPANRYVLTPGRRVSLPAQIAETMWVLAGRNDVEWLSHYLPRAADFSDDGETWTGGYGPRLRNWNGRDQLWDVVELLRKDPDTRRALVVLYDPDRDLDSSKDVPCNNWLHFLVRDGRVHLHVATRSNDIMWGWSGINTFEWSALLSFVAQLTGYSVGHIRYSISSLHLYEHHWARARNIVAGAGEKAPHGLLRVISAPLSLGPATTREQFNRLLTRWFKAEALVRAGDAAAAVGDPLLDLWLWALLSWSRGTVLPTPKNDLDACLMRSPRRKLPSPSKDAPEKAASFVEAVDALHREKDAVYGNSWKKRGEQVSILSNIARKVDRLGREGAGDTETDTAVDLLVYLIKYRLWLTDEGQAGRPLGVNPPMGMFTEDARLDEQPRYVRDVLAELGEGSPSLSAPELINPLTRNFNTLLVAVSEGAALEKVELVDYMIEDAHVYAAAHWHKQQWKEGNARRAFNGYASAGTDEPEEASCE